MTKKLPLFLTGKTKPYKGDGRRLGYPTANISTPVDLPDGVYFGFADLGPYKTQPSLIFIGAPITVGDNRRRVEAHLLDVVDTDYYDLQLELDIQYFYRSNQKFDSIDELIKAIKQDELDARSWFIKHKSSL